MATSKYFAEVCLAEPGHRTSDVSTRRSSDSSTLFASPIQGRFAWHEKLGSGSFGEIFRVTDLDDNLKNYAAKVESFKSDNPQLLHESKMFDLMKGEVGYPQKKYFAVQSEHYILVMDLLGCCLESIFSNQRERLTTRSIFALAHQMLERIEKLHAKGFVHRDIKPDNFLLDSTNDLQTSLVYLIDFGLAKPYKDRKTGQHVQMKLRGNLTGTARYASLNSHEGREQSRRDDLEALGYVILYLLRGSLPWQGMVADTKEEKFQKIYEAKKKADLVHVCRGLPGEILTFLIYARALGFEEDPDYNMLKKLFDVVKHSDDPSLDLVPDYASSSVNSVMRKQSLDPFQQQQLKPLGGRRMSGPAEFLHLPLYTSVGALHHFEDKNEPFSTRVNKHSSMWSGEIFPDDDGEEDDDADYEIGKLNLASGERNYNNHEEEEEEDNERKNKAGNFFIRFFKRLTRS